ncbi:MAG: ligase-associated DNA damage response exonuclease [Phycisphaerales bacterium]|jgi:putative mRNA 3-end processing factor|nr:ligase-associated DNA damage response exonuclease [Phycisphaerales bacterium]
MGVAATGRPDLVITTPAGLYCPAGGFHIDPWAKVEMAVTTHAHTDHARPGSTRYLTSQTGKIVLASRFGPQFAQAGHIDGWAYGRRERVGDVYVSLHPAGHVLGSAQVRIEHAATGETWVISGDYKTEDDGISEAFVPVRCHVFVTESTFGLPIYRWKPQGQVFAEINAWWRSNAASGRLSMIACYALGKAQRLLSGLDASIGPIVLHGALRSCTEAYRAAGVSLPATGHATQETARASGGRAIILAPPSAVRSAWAYKLPRPGGEMELAMASGWMSVRGTRRRRALDKGFALSDHADWPGLLGAIEATGAERIGVTHGAVETLVRYLRECKGREAFGIATQFVGEGGGDEAEQPADDATNASEGAGEGASQGASEGANA